MQHKFVPILVLVALSLLTLSCKKRDARVNWKHAQAKELLTLKFAPEKGKKMGGMLAMATDLEVLFMGQNMKTDIQLDANYLLESEGKNNEGMEVLALQVQHVKLNLNLPEMMEGKSIRYSSDEPALTEDAQVIDSYLRSYIDKPIRLQLDERAAVQKIGDFDRAMDKLSTDERAEVQGAFDQIMGSNLIEKFINFSAVLPEQPVKLGDKWTSEIQTSIAAIPINMTNDFILIDRKDGMAEIAIDSKLEVDTVRFKTEGLTGSFSELPAGAANLTRILINGSQTGNLWVDEQTGMTRESHLTQEIEMEIKIALFTAPVKVHNKMDFTPVSGSISGAE